MTNNEDLTVSGAGALVRLDVGADQAGDIVLAGSDEATFEAVVDGGSFTVSGDISQPSGTGAIAYGSPGATSIVTVSGNNTYTADTVIADGVFLAGSSTAIPSNSILEVGDDGTLDLNGNNLSVGSLTSGSGATIGLGVATLTIGGNTTTQAYAGDITGVGNLIKVGSGQQDIIGSTNYTGTTTISQGSILVAALGRLGDASGETIVQNGAELQLGALTHNEPITLEDGARLSATVLRSAMVV